MNNVVLGYSQTNCQSVLNQTRRNYMILDKIDTMNEEKNGQMNDLVKVGAKTFC